MICEFETTKFGMLKQKNVEKREYDANYTVENSATNSDMAHLRLGCLLGHVPYNIVFKGHHLELGPGNGMNMTAWRMRGITIDGYDLAPSIYSTVPKDYVYRRAWDILCAFDVIEHLDEIDDIWTIDFKYGYFSIPRLPDEGLTKTWRHYRPNEHLWYMNENSFKRWVEANQCDVLYTGCVEDTIRSRWHKDKININSYIIRRNL